MKNLFTLLLLLIPFTVFGQKYEATNTITTDIYTIYYNSSIEQPLKVEYTVKCPKGGVSREGMDFWVPKNVHTSDDDDYSNNVWDKGHMAPAAAFNCTKEMLHTTFSYVNSALQHESLNRGVWNRLEQFERNLANFFDVNVTIDVLFDSTEQRLPTGAVIPTGFRKTLTFNNTSYVFEFPNEDTKGSDWIDYLVK